MVLYGLMQITVIRGHDARLSAEIRRTGFQTCLQKLFSNDRLETCPTVDVLDYPPKGFSLIGRSLEKGDI
jgi:hypothetical protein